MSLCSAQAVVCYNSLKSVGWVKKIWVISSNVNTLLICPEFESLMYSKPPWAIRIISLNCLCLLMPTIIPQQHPAVSLTIMPHVLTASSHSAFLYPFILSTWCLGLQKLQKWWGGDPFYHYLACPQFSLWFQTLYYGYNKPQTTWNLDRPWILDREKKKVKTFGC